MVTIKKIGIGTDIESIERFHQNKKEKQPFFNKIFTKKEIEYCQSKHNPAQHFAARFAGKEAIIKALGDLEIQSPGFTMIEIINNETGVPKVILTNPKYSKIQVNLSLSHNDSMAIAFAIAQGVVCDE